MRNYKKGHKMHQSISTLILTLFLVAIIGTYPLLAVAFVGPSSSNNPVVTERSKLIHRHDTAKSFSSTTSLSQLRMGLLDMSWGTQSSSSSKKNVQTDYNIGIDDEVGSGSYGIVHLCQLLPSAAEKDKVGGDNDTLKIAKRAWTEKELLALSQEAGVQDAAAKGRSERCQYYIEVERHCLEKLASSDDEEVKKHVPNLLGVYQDNNADSTNEWLVFDLVNPDGSTSGKLPAPTLSDILEEDWIDQHAQDEADPKAHHHLYLQKALGMKDESSFGNVLDKVLVELLRAVSGVHSNNVVHRDVKPGNLLVHSGKGGAGEGGSFVLIDFGSAADMDPQSSLAAFGGNGGRVGLDDRVAISPIYAAPEEFIRWDRAPLNFDSFSLSFMFTQLLFNLLDERATASYRQQLEDCDFDLDSWLQRELAAELQLDGMEDAVLYLSERPGIWSLLRDMLHPNPEMRLSTARALKQIEKVLGGKETSVIEEADGKFFAEVVELFDQCELPDSGLVVGSDSIPTVSSAPVSEEAAISTSLTEGALVMPHPLHYIATFKRSKSLGILFSEVDPEGQYDDELSEEEAKMWEDATENALPGEIYVRGTIPGGQAEDIGILGVGDKLSGVGEFPFKAEGFGTVVEMLGAQPPSAKSVTLHFSRKSAGRSHSYKTIEPHRAKVESQGAFQMRGRRKTQEDRFILHEVQDGNNAALLTGVFDGHGGDAASTSLAQLMPSLFSVELAEKSGATGARATDLRDALESAYELACSTYRNGCDEEGLCIADYDPIEGIIVAGTGASDVVAGSTVTMSCCSVAEDGADILTVLNCGDSRTMAFGRPRGGSDKDSVVHFSTRDHSPSCELEIERLAAGKDLGYSQPECSMSRWRMKVGDYQYALARSLEGSFATSKGIVSDPDISMVNLSEMLAERELCSVALASDGLFEVIDNEQAGRYVIEWREAGLSADEVAQKMCRKAVELGSPDNVSVVVLYLG
ncbi:hypothetical protein ACHAXR_010751 [Thalassiosira sp. AJA248-18]